MNSGARIALDIDTYRRRQEAGRRNAQKRWGPWRGSDSLYLRVESGAIRQHPQIDQPYYQLGARTDGLAAVQDATASSRPSLIRVQGPVVDSAVTAGREEDLPTHQPGTGADPNNHRSGAPIPPRNAPRSRGGTV